MSKNSLLKVGVKSDSELNATGPEPQPTVHQHSLSQLDKPAK